MKKGNIYPNCRVCAIEVESVGHLVSVCSAGAERVLKTGTGNATNEGKAELLHHILHLACICISWPIITMALVMS